MSRASDESVHTALDTALAGIGIRTAGLRIQRSENVYESSNVSEVLKCSCPELTLPPLLCKYGPSQDHDHLGLRHGLTYEAAVYRNVLRDRFAAPRFFGSYDDPESGLSWLFLEYLGEGWQLDLGPEDAIVDAASMMGELQRRACAAAAHESGVLNRYDRRYFATCLSEAQATAGRWRARVSSFDHLVRGFADRVELLLRAQATLVHGEFTPHNVVWAHEHPYVVDWEQAGRGAGEIDLAGLTDDWDEELVRRSTAAYVRARWPGGAPQAFAETLEAARFYWLFRWLGDPEEAGTEEEVAWLVERAEDVARSTLS